MLIFKKTDIIIWELVYLKDKRVQHSFEKNYSGGINSVTVFAWYNLTTSVVYT